MISLVWTHILIIIFIFTDFNSVTTWLMGLNSLSNLPYNYYPRIKEERYVLQSLQCRKGDFEQIILDKLLSLNNGSKA